MDRTATLTSGPSRRLGVAIASGFALVLLSASAPASASDGCLVLLCLAAPSWRSIQQCVDPVREVFRDLARGRPFPTCAMSGGANQATHQAVGAPGNCPPQYTLVTAGVDLPIYTCRFTGVISVAVNGSLWSRVWWNRDDSVTEYTPASKAQLASWDPRFDDDLSAWTAAQPSIPQAPLN